MKKLFLSSVLLLSFIAFSFAQSGADNLKDASKLLAKYNKDPFANSTSLSEAINLLKDAFSDESVKNNPQSWITRAEIFKSLADSQSKTKLIDPNFVITEPLAAVNALNAYLKADELAKEADSKTAKKVNKSTLSGVAAMEELLNSFGISAYQLDGYEHSLANFEGELSAFEFLKNKGAKSRLDDPALYDDKMFFTAVSASLLKNHEKTVTYCEIVVEKGTEEAIIYQFLYQAYQALENEDKALEIMQKGRELFPDDNNLLFSEINYFLEKGELEKMVENLEAALAKEPENVSVVTTLGQVYDQLSVAAEKDGDAAKSEEYFNEAAKFYLDALNTNSDNFDLNYNIGALYYNKAATFTDNLNVLADDFSATGVKKYDALKAEMQGYFEKAMPYFLKADSINDKDRNTLIALKEIAARNDDFAGSEVYKQRLENLEE